MQKTQYMSLFISPCMVFQCSSTLWDFHNSIEDVIIPTQYNRVSIDVIPLFTNSSLDFNSQLLLKTS